MTNVESMEIQNLIKNELWARLDEVMDQLRSGEMISSTTLGNWLGDRVVAALIENYVLGVHGPFGYISTACRHATEPGRKHLHLECQTGTTRYDGTEKLAAQCKYGEGKEPCMCLCHKGEIP